MPGPVADSQTAGKKAGRDSGQVERLRHLLGELEVIERPSASAGELEAAAWITGKLRELGLEAGIEVERAHGTYWWPIAVGLLGGLAGSVAAASGRRLLGGLLGAAGAAAIIRDFPPHERPVRQVLPQKETFNVLAGLGPEDAERTVVLVSHHDAAHSGLVFHPGIPDAVSRTRLFEVIDTSPMLMAPVLAGPALAAVSALTGRRGLARAGAVLSAGSLASMADIALRDVVPGANDNGTAVVGLIELARRFTEDPPAKTRVVLLSCGSEESFSEGMRAFGKRHFPGLPADSTFFINMDTIGSPHLCVLRGEGFLKMYEYPEEALRLADRTAAEQGIDLYPNLRIRNGTDGLEALAAGYPVVSICSCTDHKQPANYHWPNDTAENVDFQTVGRAIDLAEAMVRRLDTDWDRALGRGRR